MFDIFFTTYITNWNWKREYKRAMSDEHWSLHISFDFFFVFLMLLLLFQFNL